MKKNSRGEKNPHQITETWTIKTLHDSPQQEQEQEQQGQQEQQQHDDITLEPPAAAVVDLPSTSNHLYQPNYVKRISKNRRRGGAFKPRFVVKSEVNSVEEECSVAERVEEQVQGEASELKDENINCTTSTSELEKIECNADWVDDIENSFEKLRLHMEEEPNLSEDQLNLNLQLQQDELLALESIYGDNAMTLDKQRSLLCLKVHIHIETPNEINIATKLNLPGDIKTENGVSDEFIYAFKVQYLPPIELTCLLPKSYPSHLPPSFIISVKWLDSASISLLCSMLDSIWEEQKGVEVIYQWVEWLHSSSLPYLRFDKEIILSPYGTKHVGDSRAISGNVAPDADIVSLKNYNDMRCHENFVLNLQACCICYSEYTGAEFIRLPCQHFFCEKCMKIYADMHVKEGTVNKLLCPDTKCDVMFPPNVVKRLLGDEEYERWESLMLERTLALMSDIVYCPRCETVCIEDEDQHAQCPKCFFSFCSLCRDKRHVGKSCMTPEMKLQILQERQNSSQLKGREKKKELEMINEILSIKEILRDAKQCPSCNLAISRTEGCNKMVCFNCGKYFCYHCNQAIAGYDHYRDGGCDLFSQAMIQNWEEQMNPRQARAQAQARVHTGHGQACPNCGQFNPKIENNNHLFCWACQIHYCYLCKKVVRRSSEHYGGPKKCKQHSTG